MKIFALVIVAIAAATCYILSRPLLIMFGFGKCGPWLLCDAKLVYDLGYCTIHIGWILAGFILVSASVGLYYLCLFFTKRPQPTTSGTQIY